MIVGFIVFYVLKRFSKGKTVGDIADIKEGKVEIRGFELFVDDIYVSNQLGTENARKLFQNEGIAIVIYPYPREELLGLHSTIMDKGKPCYLKLPGQ